MNKKLLAGISAWIIWLWAVIAPSLTMAAQWWFWQQRQTTIWLAGANVWWSWDEWFISFVQNAVNWILSLLGLITIIILVYGGFLMVTAAWDEGKYKKWFTILKQAFIWLILIGVSALIVNLIFHFVTTTTTGGAQ